MSDCQQRVSRQEYVVCHELVHLRVPEHGQVWQALIGDYLPDCGSGSSAWRGGCCEREKSVHGERLSPFVCLTPGSKQLCKKAR